MIEDIPDPVAVHPSEVVSAAPASNPYLALFVVCFSLVIVVIDNTILNIALPALLRDLRASTSDLQWIVDAYTLTYACFMLTGGSLGDRYGRRRSLFWGVLGFGMASALACFASSSEMLIACRALMGVCAAFMTPASLSIVTNLFDDPRERSRAIVIWVAVASVGAAAGPVVGGVLLQHFWWGSVFLVNVPVAVLLVIALPIVVPETRDPHPNAVDPLGAALSIVFLSAVLWATISGPEHGWTSPIIIGTYALGIVMLGVFIWWEKHCDHPMLDLGFFRIPAFSASTVANSAMVAAWGGTAFVFVLLLQSVLGYSPLEAGLRLVPIAVIGIIGSLASDPLANAFGRKRVIVSGLLIEALGSAPLMTYLPSQGYGPALAYFAIFSAGQSLVFSQCVAEAMTAVPQEKAGMASGATSAVRQVALAFGVAIAGSVLASSYRHNLAVKTADSGFDPDTLSDAARSIAGAVRTAGELPAESGNRLLEAARDAFVPALHAWMLVAAAICLLGAVAGAIWLPGGRNDP